MAISPEHQHTLVPVAGLLLNGVGAVLWTSAVQQWRIWRRGIPLDGQGVFRQGGPVMKANGEVVSAPPVFINDALRPQLGD